MTRLIPSLLLLTACPANTDQYKYKGYTTEDFFPLDGTRSWEYANEQTDLLWRMRVDKSPQVVQDGSTEIVTLEYSNDETGDLLYSIAWSSDSSGGIRIWSYSDELTGDNVTYDPPINFTDATMVPGDTIESEGNGTTFVATFESFEDCDNTWATGWECMKVVMDDGDGDDMSGPPFAGTWWIATSYGASRFIPTGYDEAWVLATASFTADEE